MSMERTLSHSRSATNTSTTSFSPQKIEKQLEQHGFFQYLDPALVQKLGNELVPRVYNDNDYIIRKGEVGRAMFIVVKGIIDVVSEDGTLYLITNTLN
jgi:signal-transduction protein with cAMP-binding, CBS, and nucleotidyltransferase domain